MKAERARLQAAARHISKARQAFASTQYHVAEMETQLAYEALRCVLDEMKPKARRKARAR